MHATTTTTTTANDPGAAAPEATVRPPALPADTEGAPAAAGPVTWGPYLRYDTSPMVFAAVTGPDVTVGFEDRVVVVFGGEETPVAPAVVPELVRALVNASEGPRDWTPDTVTVPGWARDLTVTAYQESRDSPEMVSLRAEGPRDDWKPDHGPLPRASREASVLDPTTAGRVAALLLVLYWRYVVPRHAVLDDADRLLRDAVADVQRAATITMIGGPV